MFSLRSRVGWLILFWLGWSCSSATGQPRTPEQRCSENLQLILSSLGKFSKDHQGLYPDRLSQLVPRYLAEVPTCPLQGGSYETYSVFAHQPERAVLICSDPGHSLLPPDYIVLSTDRGLESPFARQADPTNCRRTLIQLSQQLTDREQRLGAYPARLPREFNCACGDPIQYCQLENGHSFLAYCPGAAHLGSGLAPFSPYLTPRGLKEESLVLGPPGTPLPSPERQSSTSSSSSYGLGILLVFCVLLLGFSMRRRRIRLDL